MHFLFIVGTRFRTDWRFQRLHFLRMSVRMTFCLIPLLLHLHASANGILKNSICQAMYPAEGELASSAWSPCKPHKSGTGGVSNLKHMYLFNFRNIRASIIFNLLFDVYIWSFCWRLWLIRMTDDVSCDVSCRSDNFYSRSLYISCISFEYLRMCSTCCRNFNVIQTTILNQV